MVGREGKKVSGNEGEKEGGREERRWVRGNDLCIYNDIVIFVHLIFLQVNC